MIITEEDLNKTLLTLGCSFLEKCWDDEKVPPNGIMRAKQLKSPYDKQQLVSERVSTLLAKYLNRKDINLARSGQGNLKSIDDGIEYIKKHRFDDIKVLVGFTEFGRYNFKNVETGHQHKISPAWNTFKGIYPELPIQELIDKFYMYYYDEEQQIRIFINRVITFDSFCKKWNIKPVYFFAYEYFKLSKNPEELKKRLYEELVVEHKINLFNFNSNQNSIVSWPEYITDYDDTYVRAHPIIDDNYKLFELLKPYFIKKLL